MHTRTHSPSDSAVWTIYVPEVDISIHTIIQFDIAGIVHQISSESWDKIWCLLGLQWICNDKVRHFRKVALSSEPVAKHFRFQPWRRIHDPWNKFVAAKCLVTVDDSLSLEGDPEQSNASTNRSMQHTNNIMFSNLRPPLFAKQWHCSMILRINDGHALFWRVRRPPLFYNINNFPVDRFWRKLRSEVLQIVNGQVFPVELFCRQWTTVCNVNNFFFYSSFCTTWRVATDPQLTQAQQAHRVV